MTRLLPAFALLGIVAACATPGEAPSPAPATKAAPLEPASPVTSPPFSSGTASWRVVLIHLSDSEAGLLPDDGSETGGIARAQAVISSLKDRAGPDEIVLGVGDLFIPAPELDLQLDGKSAVLQGNNKLFLQASALGNHELDLGEQFLAEAIAQMTFPYLSATLTVKDGPLKKLVVDVPTNAKAPWATDVAGKLLPRAKVCQGTREGDGDRSVCKGLTVGLVGATTEQLRVISSGASANLATPNDLDGVRAAVQAQVDALRAEGVEVIILLSHLQGAAREAELVQSGLIGVDVVLAGGGENKLAAKKHRLAETDVPDRLCGSEAFGAPCYPTTIVAKDGRPVLLAATGGDLRYVGNLITWYDERGVLTSYHEAGSRPWPVDEESLLELRASVNKETLAFQQRARAELMPLLEVVATSNVFLEGRREEVRNRETNLGDLSADAIQFASSQAGAAPALSLRNGGGIRGPLGLIDASTKEKKGAPIRVLDLKTALRFDSPIVVVQTTHVGLRRTLESALRGAGTSKGHFPQVSREVVLEYTVAAPEQTHVLEDGKVARVACPGARVRKLIVKGADGKDVVVVKDGKVLTPDAQIRVATLDYLANGGDGWFPGETASSTSVAGVTEQSSLRSFLAAEEKAGRWRGGAGYVDGVATRILKSDAAPAEADVPEACRPTAP